MSGVVAGSVMSGIFESAIYLLHHLEPRTYNYVRYPVWSASNTPTYMAGRIFSPVQLSPFPYARARTLGPTNLLASAFRADLSASYSSGLDKRNIGLQIVQTEDRARDVERSKGSSPLVTMAFCCRCMRGCCWLQIQGLFMRR